MSECFVMLTLDASRRPAVGGSRTRAARLAAVMACLLVAGCAAMVRSAGDRLADNLSMAILDQNDLETVREGAPAYLLMLDAMVEGDPDNSHLLLSAARLYGAYAGAFVKDKERALRLVVRGREYARRALCLRDQGLCQAAARPLAQFQAELARVPPGEVPVLFGFAAAWAGWVQASTGDWQAVADIPKITAAMQRVVELNEAYDGGAAHLYLGVLASQLPANLGGRPEQARRHFERAVELSAGRNLMVKVLYAKYYARLVFDRTLHDRLVSEVLTADPVQPGLTLMNTLAQREARALQASADSYF